MRKSREFDDALDACLERLLVEGETLEQCLQSFPEYVAELKPLLETALSVKQVSAIQPRPELKDRVRYQFYSALQGREAKKGVSFLSWQPRWAVVVAIVLVFLLAGSSTVAAAGNSMPDEPLYPLKLATERVRLVFTPSALGKMELYAQLADRRVLEIVNMASENKPEQIERTTQRFAVYLTRIADLSSIQGVTGGVAMVPAVAEAPAVERAPLMSERARGGKEKGFGDGRRAKLRETVGHYAANHPERLRALLNRVPPSARPALLRAIAVSETGYKKALESLD